MLIKSLRPLSLCILAAAASPAPAWHLQVDITADSAQIATSPHRLRGLDGSLLYTEQNGRSDLVAGVGYLVKAWLLGKGQNFYVSTGGKVFLADAFGEDFAALAWRNVLRYEPHTWPQVQLSVELDYAPGFSTSGVADELWLASGQLEYSLSSRSDLIVGWRRMGTDIQDQGTQDVDRGGYLGFAVRF